jgi:hypothetical protein
MLAKVAATVTFLCLLSLPLSLRAQDSLLGHHKINLELKPLPAAEVLNLLSVRSKSAAHSADRPADAGGVWEVEGAEQLAGIVVKVHFVETPVSQVVGQILGCIGFAYQEQGDRIVIEKAAQRLPAARCRSVSIVSASAVASAQTQAAPDQKYSWQFASISALEFIGIFAKQSGLNIVVPATQNELLRDIELSVNISDRSADEVVKDLFGCIAWNYQQTSAGISAFKGAPRASECRDFTVLSEQMKR